MRENILKCLFFLKVTVCPVIGLKLKNSTIENCAMTKEKYKSFRSRDTVSPIKTLVCPCHPTF